MRINYTDIVAKIATTGWGKEYSSQEAAEKELLQDKQSLSAFASIELLRRLECLADSLGGRNKKVESPRVSFPAKAAVMPDVNVGDRLYEYSTDEGISEFIVVAKDESNHCMMVAIDDFDLQWGPTTRIADKDTQATPEEAMRIGAKKQIEWYGREVEFAKELLIAADSKQSLDAFRLGCAEESEDD